MWPPPPLCRRVEEKRKTNLIRRLNVNIRAPEEVLLIGRRRRKEMLNKSSNKADVAGGQKEAGIRTGVERVASLKSKQDWLKPESRTVQGVCY